MTVRADGLRYLAAESSKTTGYKPKKSVPCDECLLVRHESGGEGEVHPARLRRVCESRAIVLCYGHAHLWRVADGRRAA